MFEDCGYVFVVYACMVRFGGDCAERVWEVEEVGGGSYEEGGGSRRKHVAAL